MHSAYWNVLVWVLLSANVILLTLGVWELLKRTRLGKLMGVAWLAFAVCFGCVAAGLNSENRTWHLRNSQKPWAFIAKVDSVILASGAAAVFALARAKILLKVPEGKLLELETGEEDGVWPPAPRKL